MDLFEFQGKELFARHGIDVPAGALAESPAAAREAAVGLGLPVVIKAQVLTGGRGKAGGVRVAQTPEEAEAFAQEILGLEIRGHQVRRVWIEPAASIASEIYAAVALDRSAHRPVVILSAEGGVDIETLAEERPDALVRRHVDPRKGLDEAAARAIAADAGLTDAAIQTQVAGILVRLYECFTAEDALLCEINPLAVLDGSIGLLDKRQLRALDAKVTVDDSALFRHPDLADLRDPGDADPLEALAREKNVTYVKLDGTVGILGNGAGLAMSTVDVVVVVGGTPANFCDLGGGGSAQGVVDALEVIGRDPQVRAVFFNIFGGITRCDEVARGILEALDRIELAVPMVVRLDGTNAAEGRAILTEAGRSGVEVAPTMLDAARRAVELAA